MGAAALTPTLDAFNINYNELIRFDPASIGAVGGAADLGITRLTPTTTKFQNQLVGTGVFIVNALVG